MARRRRMSRRQSRKIFRRGAVRVARRNLRAVPMRASVRKRIFTGEKFFIGVLLSGYGFLNSANSTYFDI